MNYFKLQMVLTALGTVVSVVWFCAVMAFNTEHAEKFATPLMNGPIQFAADTSITAV